MKRQLIVDFSSLYYKYFFRLQKAEKGITYMPRLSYIVDDVETDTTYQYYITKDIEQYRQMCGDDTTVSICFDSKTNRKDDDATYKSNRGGKLDTQDFKNMENLMQMYKDMGYNVYKVEGMEADDLIHTIVQKTKNEYQETYILSPDKDLLVNVSDNVFVIRTSTTKQGFKVITPKTYESELSASFKCRVPFNSIMLYLSMVGDKVDCIDGINGFGPKAFDKLIAAMESNYYPFNKLDRYENVEEVLVKYEDVYDPKCKGYMEQALKSLELVKYRDADFEILEKHDTEETRNSIYEKYGMKSLMK